MPAYLLRVEAVNLDHFITDTEDLSTIRGGGLMLLNSPRTVKKLLELKGVQPQEVLSGASQCMFSFDATDQEAAEKIRESIEYGLREIVPGDPLNQLGHATFVVDCIPAGTAFQRDKETLLARNRWRQMGQLRLSPVLGGDGDAKKPCGIDLVRPATEWHPSGNQDKQKVSPSASVRAVYGRDKKENFYAEMGAPLKQGLKPAWDFHELSARGPNRYEDDLTPEDPYSRLNDKIAVIYIDGNGFGKLQQKLVSDATTQKQFDEHIQGFRRKVLSRLVSSINSETLTGHRWRCRLDLDNKPRVVARLETLMWGGDELMWVVPAWQALATVQLFFEEAGKYYGSAEEPKKTADPLPKPAARSSGGKPPNLNAPKKKPSTAPVVETAQKLGKDGLPVLTHACGMVFCHSDTPIQGVIKLSKDLAEKAKDKSRDVNSLNYAVLESFDTLGQDFETARRNHMPQGLDPILSVLDAADLKALIPDCRQMAAHFPRGSVYRILKALRKGDGKEFERWVERAKREAGDIPLSFPTKYIPGDHHLVNWLHLSEFWDYLGEEAASA